MKVNDGKGHQTMRDRVLARAKTRENSGGLSTLILPEGVDLYKPEKGRAEFDILPYRVTVDTHPEVKKGELYYERTYLAHRNIGPEEKFLICPRTIGKKCPICEEHAKLRKDPDADEDVVDALRAKERELFNVVLKDGKGEIQILDISTYLFGQKLEEEVREGDESNATFPELTGGKTLRVRWDQSSMGKQKFVEASRIDFLDREEDYDESVLEQTVDLDRAMKIMTYEEIAAIFHGADEPEDKGEAAEEEPEEEEAPARRVLGKKPAAKKPEPEEPEDEPADDEPEDEPEDDIPMGKKPVAKKPAKPVDDEPEEEPEDEDEAEPEECIACDGTGKTSKGKTCPICDGTGKVADPDAGEPVVAPPKKVTAKEEEPDEEDADEEAPEDDEPEEEPAAPARKVRRVIR